MEEITLSFTPEELKELAKQLHLGAHIYMCPDGYKNEVMAEELMLRICKAGYYMAPETDGFACGLSELDIPYQISDEVFYECEDLIKEYDKRAMLEYLPDALACRDYKEKYGEIDENEIVKDRKLFGTMMDMQTDYKPLLSEIINEKK
jgi:hypothetical protein